MRTGDLQSVLEHLRLADGGLTDGQLLTRFLDGQEEAAFAALVRRHGPMVLGVCRRVLRHAQDAEDVFQATFLVLARKASSVAKREAVASFLYSIAYRTALRARVHTARRRAVERQVEEMPHPVVMPPEAQDWRPVLDRELSRLPEKYRAALVLCDLEGKPRREAARELGLPEGTLASRLATARRLLARRLTRCGVALSGGAVAAALAEGAAAVPAPWVRATTEAATRVAVGQLAAVATPAALLMNEVLKAMLMTKLKGYVATALVAVMLGLGGIAYRAGGQAPQAGVGARPLTELEVLRREVEILKLQMEVMQAKVRAQDGDLRTLKGPAGGTGPMPGSGGMGAYPARNPNVMGQGSVGGMPPLGSERPAAGAFLNQAQKTVPLDQGSIMLGGKKTLRTAADPFQEAEDALQVLRQAPDNATARQRAADTLERVLKRWRQQRKTDETAPEGGETSAK